MREITRSVKVALKCLIAVVLVDVDLPYWTSKVEHLVAFAAIVSNICTAHARNGYLCTSGVNLDTAVRFAENNARPCVKRRMSFCACAKSRDLLKVP